MVAASWTGLSTDGTENTGVEVVLGVGLLDWGNVVLLLLGFLLGIVGIDVGHTHWLERSRNTQTRFAIRVGGCTCDSGRDSRYQILCVFIQNRFRFLKLD